MNNLIGRVSDYISFTRTVDCIRKCRCEIYLVCTVRDIILCPYHQLQIIFQLFYIPRPPISLAWTFLIGKTCVSVRKIYNRFLSVYDCKISSRIAQFLPVLTSIYSSPVIISRIDCICDCSDKNR